VLRFAWGLQPEQVRVARNCLVLLVDHQSFLRRAFLPWDRDQRDTALSCFSVRNCGALAVKYNLG
jgi:hypothetical protein